MRRPCHHLGGGVHGAPLPDVRPPDSATAYGPERPPVTLTVWHGWTDEREASAFQAMLDRFHLLHPNIGVRAVGGVTDSQIINGIRSEQNVDVVSSFTTDDVGLYCGSGAWVDLNPFLRSSGIDAAKTFTAPSLAYSAYHGDQCALPLLGDTFGLYYNKAMFAKAGIERPPRTLSELEADAAKLTVRAADGSLRVAGFLPDVDWYENAPDHLQSVFGIRFQDADNRSVLAGDPGVASELRFQSRMMAVLGGADEAQAFAAGPAAGDENSAANAFLTGKVAMAVGESGPPPRSPPTRPTWTTGRRRCRWPTTALPPTGPAR
ncbi:extracellular solute-binding protein [Catenulispora yoronensis]